MKASGKIKEQKGSSPYSIGGNSGDAAPSACNDANLDAKRQDRGYNPANEAKRGQVSGELNSDAARNRKGPSPL